ncbi:MAG: TatD family hydrolase [Thermoplasmataceae archaeon]
MDAAALSGRGYIIMDDHMHLREDGRFTDAVGMFVSAGGNCINLVNVPREDFSIDHYYENLYANTISIADTVRKKYGIAVLVTLGPYPLDYFRFEQAGYDPVIEMKKGIDLAINFAEKGLCNALGEVGRPHFPVEESVVSRSNEILEYGMERCRDASIPIMLHTEDLSEYSYSRLTEMAEKSGLRPEMVVKHHALPQDLAIDVPVRRSILASKSNVRKALAISNDFLLETDYVDDPESWKVIPPDSVPRRISMILQERDDWESFASRCCMKLPVEIYGQDCFRAIL